VDFVHSGEALRHRHIYRVRLNEDLDYPQMAEVIAVVAPAQRAADRPETDGD
jgi:hypothetical protein